MRWRPAWLVLAAASATVALAERRTGLPMRAFLQAVPEASAGAFSPVAFELDAVVIGGALSTLDKARYVEALGAQIGCEDVYQPIRAAYEAGVTNGLDLLSARLMTVPDVRRVPAAFRTAVQQTWAVEMASTGRNGYGAESWACAAMDGRREDFRLPPEVVRVPAASLVELTSLRLDWGVPWVSVADAAVAFAGTNGVVRSVPGWSGVCAGALWENRRFTLLSLPMASGCRFVALMPSAGHTLETVRGEVASPERMDYLRTVTSSVIESGVYTGPIEVRLPKLGGQVRNDLRVVLERLGLPTAGFAVLPTNRLAVAVQDLAYSVADPQADGESAGPAGRSVALERPFLYFIWHGPTDSVVLAGQFTGEGLTGGIR